LSTASCFCVVPFNSTYKLPVHKIVIRKDTTWKQLRSKDWSTAGPTTILKTPGVRTHFEVHVTFFTNHLNIKK
jgi:hypothetical protein